MDMFKSPKGWKKSYDIKMFEKIQKNDGTEIAIARLFQHFLEGMDMLVVHESEVFDKPCKKGSHFEQPESQEK